MSLVEFDGSVSLFLLLRTVYGCISWSAEHYSLSHHHADIIFTRGGKTTPAILICKASQWFRGGSICWSRNYKDRKWLPFALWSRIWFEHLWFGCRSHPFQRGQNSSSAEWQTQSFCFKLLQWNCLKAVVLSNNICEAAAIPRQTQL